MIKVKIPGLLREDSDNRPEVSVEAETIHEAISGLVKQCPGLKQRIYNASGDIKKYIRFYINEEIIETDKYKNLFLKEGDIISLIVPVAGG